MSRPLFTRGKDPVPTVQEVGWAPGPVWTGAENLAPHRDSIPGPSSPQPVAIPMVMNTSTKIINLKTGQLRAMSRQRRMVQSVQMRHWKVLLCYENMSTSVVRQKNLDNNGTLFLKSSLFRDVAQGTSSVPYVSGTTDPSHLQRSSSPGKFLNYPSTPRNIAEERRPYQHRGEACNHEKFFI